MGSSFEACGTPWWGGAGGRLELSIVISMGSPHRGLQECMKAGCEESILSPAKAKLDNMRKIFSQADKVELGMNRTLVVDGQVTG